MIRYSVRSLLVASALFTHFLVVELGHEQFANAVTISSTENNNDIAGDHTLDEIFGTFHQPPI